MDYYIEKKIYNETKLNDSIEGIDILTYKCKENAGQEYIFPTIEETYYVNNTFSVIKIYNLMYLKRIMKIKLLTMVILKQVN